MGRKRNPNSLLVLGGPPMSRNDRTLESKKRQVSHAGLAQIIPSHSNDGVTTNGEPFLGSNIGHAYFKKTHHKTPYI